LLHGWFGHPLQRTPIVLLEHYIWAPNMAVFLRERGWDPEKFKAKGLPEAGQGHYARTSAQFPRFQEERELPPPLRWCETCRRNTPWLNERCSACKGR
jgi:hypothetical protein